MVLLGWSAAAHLDWQVMPDWSYYLLDIPLWRSFDCVVVALVVVVDWIYC